MGAPSSGINAMGFELCRPVVRVRNRGGIGYYLGLSTTRRSWLATPGQTPDGPWGLPASPIQVSLVLPKPAGRTAGLTSAIIDITTKSPVRSSPRSQSLTACRPAKRTPAKTMFGSFRRYFSTDLAIDLGTANTLIYVRG